jgi:hypothetical protein
MMLFLSAECWSRPGCQGVRPASTPDRVMISATVSSWRYAITCTPCMPRMAADLLDQFDADVAPFARLILRAGQPLDDGIGNMHPGTWLRIHSAPRRS